MERALEIRAMRTGPAAVLEPRESSLGAPARGEVQVTVEAAGVAYADIVMRRGLYPSLKPPLTPGYDFVGRIEGIGEGVTGLSVGQRVAAVTVHGSYATRRNVEARWVVAAPANADAGSLVAAALNGVTALQLLRRIACVPPGEWILVHGAAGGVGSLLLDLARLSGVQVIGVASKSKARAVTARGAVALDYERDDIVKRTKELSGGGVAAAFDHIGGSHFKRISMRSLKPTGVGVLYGAYNATRHGRIRPLAIMDALLNARFSGYTLFERSRGVVGYSLPAWRDARVAAYREDLSAVLQMVGDGVLSPLIGAVFPLQEAARAHIALEQRSVEGKIVLTAN